MIQARRAFIGAILGAAALIVADPVLAQRDDINVNPYGDPIWQQQEPGKSKVRRHVKRSRSHPRHVRHAQTKPRAHAKVSGKKLRPAKQRSVGKPLNIVPPVARTR
jgi:hypothetical protein